MSTQTSNLQLIQPSEDEYYDIAVQNENMDKIDTFCGRKDNPHGVTAEQVGLGKVPNVATNDQTPTYSDTTTLATLTSGEKISTAFGKIKLAITNLINHLANKSNPHGVTTSQISANTTFGLLKSVNLLEWAMAQTTGGTFMTDATTVTGVPITRYWRGVLVMNTGAVDRGIFIFDGAVAYFIATSSQSFDNQEWMEVANASEVLSTDGGFMNGYIVFNNLSNYFALQKGRTINDVTYWLTLGIGSDGASVLEHYTGSGTTNFGEATMDARLELRPTTVNLLNALIIRDYANNILYKVFGEHNKPISTYAGTGVARTISTGGVGNALLIFGSNSYNAFVTPHGAMCFFGSTLAGFGSDSIKFAEGVLTIGTTNPTSAYFNASGITYTYQVL